MNPARALSRPCPALLTLLALGACEPPPKGLSSSHPCQAVYGLTSGGSRFTLVQVYDDELPDGLTLELIYPERQTWFAEGAPVVVVLGGGFGPEIVPLDDPGYMLRTDLGIVQVIVDFPGGERPFSTPGFSDHRGSSARKAVSLALRYAAGWIRDSQDCAIEERVPVRLSGIPLMIHGESNGGNLAFATLADSGRELPPVGAITTFETPAGAQFAAVELGTPGQGLPIYQEGVCSWERESGLCCEIDDSLLAWAPDAMKDGQKGAIYYDLDQSGTFEAGVDYAIWGLRPQEGKDVSLVFSPSLTRTIEAKELEVPGLRSSKDSSLFWATRDASRSAEDALARFPDLAVIAVGTRADHLAAVSDHAHVSGLASVLHAVGSRWIRVNPDASYVRLLVEQDLSFADNPANLNLSPGDPAATMEPEESLQECEIADYNTAAILELADRLCALDWSPNLSARIPPRPCVAAGGDVIER